VVLRSALQWEAAVLVMVIQGLAGFSNRYRSAAVPVHGGTPLPGSGSALLTHEMQLPGSSVRREHDRRIPTEALVCRFGDSQLVRTELACEVRQGETRAGWWYRGQCG